MTSRTRITPSTARAMEIVGQTYSNLDDVADRLRTLQGSICESENSLLATRVELGLTLIKAKDFVGHGHWTDWLNTHGIHSRMSRRSMRLARDAMSVFPAVEPADLAEQYAEFYPSSRAAEVAIRARLDPIDPPSGFSAEEEDQGEDVLDLVYDAGDGVPGQLMLDHVYAQMNQRLGRVKPVFDELAEMAHNDKLDAPLMACLDDFNRAYAALSERLTENPSMNQV